MVPVSAVEAAGYTVRASRYAPSPHVNYAMFAGGGLAWAERAMKAGEYAVDAAPAGTRPDLSGLSCRWNDIPATRGTMLSLLVAPVGRDDPAFRQPGRVAGRGDRHERRSGAPGARRRAGHVLAAAGTRPRGERGAAAGRVGDGARGCACALHAWFAWLIMTTGAKVGGFDPARYRREVVANSDFRKYDDHLRMTIDCTHALADRLEARLERARDDGVVRYGLHRQAAAIMTCVVPNADRERPPALHRRRVGRLRAGCAGDEGGVRRAARGARVRFRAGVASTFRAPANLRSRARRHRRTDARKRQSHIARPVTG